ncbi:hypothetical protein [Actinomadura alba]|uniref:Uncharacterized protein n=1 Tax=Actinomadura alba TaxID=406431 RepID=A0ABR7LP80_9ACTN|nr:hypothetical protein [Actinomadura alba]MBC6466655.1 hypothetical protein [Actinomadura alba]
MGFETTAADVVGRFNVTPRAQRTYSKWLGDESRTEVVDYVSGHRTRLLHEVDPAHVEQTCRSTDHALDNVQKTMAVAVEPIESWNPAFAFTHVLHYAIEKERRILTWQQFFSFIREDPLADRMLWTPSILMTEQVLEQYGDRWSKFEVHSAIRWRVGNAYYSFLREVYVVSHWRALGLDVRVHPLADALFRVDAWYQNTVVSLYVGNRRYRERGVGRKISVTEMLGGAQPPFRFVEIRLPAASRFGEVLLPSLAEVRSVARRIDPDLSLTR